MFSIAPQTGLKHRRQLPEDVHIEGRNVLPRKVCSPAYDFVLQLPLVCGPRGWGTFTTPGVSL